MWVGRLNSNQARMDTHLYSSCNYGNMRIETQIDIKLLCAFPCLLITSGCFFSYKLRESQRVKRYIKALKEWSMYRRWHQKTFNCLVQKQWLKEKFNNNKSNFTVKSCFTMWVMQFKTQINFLFSASHNFSLSIFRNCKYNIYMMLILRHSWFYCFEA